MNFEYEEATEGMERALEELGWGDPADDGCKLCGYDISASDDLCGTCLKDYHGPEDSDYDPECCGGFSIEVRPC
jgi:hypothetical protein